MVLFPPYLRFDPPFTIFIIMSELSRDAVVLFLFARISSFQELQTLLTTYVIHTAIMYVLRNLNRYNLFYPIIIYYTDFHVYLFYSYCCSTHSYADH